jgi:hypothetical protein
MAEKKITFSNKELSINKIEDYYLSLERSLRSFYNKNNSHFTGYTLDELEKELETCIEELGKSTALTILATIEACFTVDFLQRCYNKSKDPLSREFRGKHKKKGLKISLSEDILELWKQHTQKKSLISDLKAALKYRNWLAHGRYWIPKLGRKYDFYGCLTLSLQIQTELGIEMGA